MDTAKIKVGDMCHYPNKTVVRTQPRWHVDGWGLGMIIKIEDNGTPPLVGDRNKVYHVLEEDGTYSRHDFVKQMEEETSGTR